MQKYKENMKYANVFQLISKRGNILPIEENATAGYLHQEWKEIYMIKIKKHHICVEI